MPGDPKQQRTVGPGTGHRRVFHALGLVAKTWMWLMVSVAMTASAEDPWLSYKGGAGPGKGKKIVFVTGDEEYRSEESMPAMARILAKRHGFDCTVLFAIDPKSGEIDPKITDNIPGLDALKTARHGMRPVETLHDLVFGHSK